MANQNLPSQLVSLIPIELPYFPQVTGDVADAAVKKIIPFPFRVHRVTVGARAIGGGTPFTDVDVDIHLDANKIVDAAPVVDSSAIAGSGKGVDATLTTTLANLVGAAGSMLHMKLINTTGGASTPTLDGLVATAYIERL